MDGITVCTTFHKPGMDLYGQRFIDSFAEKVDKRINLLVYAEDCNPNNPDANQITIINAKDALPKLNAFKARWANDPRANGIPPEEIRIRRPRDHHKRFKWDAIRFANKVYAVFDACERSSHWCVWMDADTFVHSNWTYDQFKNLLPNDKWLTYVGRGKGSQTWPECGFYGLNLKDAICKDFLKEFERVYEDAENGIFKLEEWHDSFVFGSILNAMKDYYPEVLDYSAEMYIRTAKTGGGGHPLINSVLGTWIDHMKGDRKNTKKSLPKDLMVNRTEAYWNEI
tara:strand:+ start:17123 stop:17971 length:849 start_codon:yes stop_codon:yes gene_type:complete